MIIGKTHAIIEPSKARETANPFHERGLQVSFLACDRIVLKRKQSDKNTLIRPWSGQRDSIDRLSPDYLQTGPAHQPRPRDSA